MMIMIIINISDIIFNMIVFTGREISILQQSEGYLRSRRQRE
jgi:hypothetical protein